MREWGVGGTLPGAQLQPSSRRSNPKEGAPTTAVFLSYASQDANAAAALNGPVFGWYDEMARDTHDWIDEQLGPAAPPGRK